MINLILEYVLLNTLVILIYITYLNKKTKYKITIIYALLWTLIIGSINIYNHSHIEKILNNEIFGNYTLLVHFIFGIVVGLFLETLAYHIKNTFQNKKVVRFLSIVTNITIIVIYVLLSFKIDFLSKNF